MLLAGLLASTAPAAADDVPALLRIGIVAGSAGASSISGLSEIREAFAAATGIPVRIFPARDLGALVSAQTSGRVQYAIYSAVGYAAAEAVCGCLEPLVAPVGQGGDYGVRAAIYAHTGSAASIDEVAGRRIVAGPIMAVGPQLLGLERLADAGAGDDVMHANSMEDAEARFLTGDAELLVGWEPAANDPAIVGSGTAAGLMSRGMQSGEFQLLWQSETVRYGPHVVRADLPETVKQSLRTFLTTLSAQSPRLYDFVEREHLGGFVRVSREDYAMAAKIAQLAAE